MTKIEYIENELDPDKSGWYIVEYASLGARPDDMTGPYATKAQAVRMLADEDNAHVG
jgi:hypothetical protein